MRQLIITVLIITITTYNNDYVKYKELGLHAKWQAYIKINKKFE